LPEEWIDLTSVDVVVLSAAELERLTGAARPWRRSSQHQREAQYVIQLTPMPGFALHLSACDGPLP